MAALFRLETASSWPTFKQPSPCGTTVPIRPAPLFGSCVGDSVADRILEALQAADNGLTRKQIRDLFHGHLGSASIDQALERLRSLGLATFRYVPGRGPYTTLWSATDYEDPELAEEETAGPEEFLRQET